MAARRDARPGVGVRFYVGLAYGLWLSALLVLRIVDAEPDRDDGDTVGHG